MYDDLLFVIKVNRPLDAHPDFIAGVEINRYLYATGTNVDVCACVAVKKDHAKKLVGICSFGAGLRQDLLRL